MRGRVWKYHFICHRRGEEAGDRFRLPSSYLIREGTQTGFRGLSLGDLLKFHLNIHLAGRHQEVGRAIGLFLQRDSLGFTSGDLQGAEYHLVACIGSGGKRHPRVGGELGTEGKRDTSGIQGQLTMLGGSE